VIYGGVFLFILASKSSTFVTEGDWQETCSSIGIVAQMTNSYLKIFRFLIDLYLGISKRPSRKIPVATEMGWGQDLKVRFPYLTIWTFPEDPTGLNFYWGNIGVFPEDTSGYGDGMGTRSESQVSIPDNLDLPGRPHGVEF